MKLLEKAELILDEEKNCLLKGDYYTLENIAKIKIKLFELLRENIDELPVGKIGTLAQKSRRNEALLLSAQRGIKSAIMHLGESTESTFRSYSKEGCRTPLSKAQTIQHKV